jgi:hypothetical protein
MQSLEQEGELPELEGSAQVPLAPGVHHVSRRSRRGAPTSFRLPVDLDIPSQQRPARTIRRSAGGRNRKAVLSLALRHPWSRFDTSWGCR